MVYLDPLTQLVRAPVLKEESCSSGTWPWWPRAGGEQNSIKAIYEQTEVSKNKLKERQTPKDNRAASSLILMAVGKC